MNKQLRKVKKAADAARPIFIEYEGVLGVGYGYKCTGGQVTDELAIVVWVEKKLLNDNIVSGQYIPAQYARYPTDVEMVQFSSDKDVEDTTGLHEGRSIFEFLDWGKIHRLNVEQKGGTLRYLGKVTPRPIGHTKPEFNSPDTEVKDDLFIIEDDNTLTYLTDGGVGIPDFVGSWNLFREEFGDDYDFVSLYFDEAVRGTLWIDNQFAHLYRDREESGYNRDPVDYRTSFLIDSTRLLGFSAYFTFNRRDLIHLKFYVFSEQSKIFCALCERFVYGRMDQ